MAAAPLDIERLSAPISSVSPAGEDIRMGSKVELYYRLKDARSLARNEERSQAPGEPLRLSAACGRLPSSFWKAPHPTSKFWPGLQRLNSGSTASPVLLRSSTWVRLSW